MTLENLANLAEVIGVVAVIASLVFVGIQIRDGNRLARAQMHQQVADSLISFTMAYGGFSNEAGEAMHDPEVLKTLPRSELEHFSAYQIGYWKHMENVYYQHQNGFVADSYWFSTVTLATVVLNRPGVQVWWQARKSMFAKEFVDFIDSQPVPEAPIDIRKGVSEKQP